MNHPLGNRLAAEIIGTFILIFAGTGAIVVNHESHGAITHAGIALTFGLVVTALIHTFGDVSGAHLNPAVTCGLVAAGRFPPRDAAPYIAAQCGGRCLPAPRCGSCFHRIRRLGPRFPWEAKCNRSRWKQSSQPS